MTTQIQVTSNAMGETVVIDNITVKQDGVMVVGPITHPPAAPQTTGLHLMSSYESSSDLVAACRTVKPKFDVRCDVTTVWHGDDPTLPRAQYGSADNGYVNLMEPHDGITAAPNPTPPDNPTTVTSTTVPGVNSGGLTPATPPPDTRVFPPPGPGMDPLYGQAGHRDYFVHGPAVETNDKGQLVDAEGRTAGPLPKPSYESVEGEMIRLGGKTYDGVRYDAWGNRLSPKDNDLPQLDPVYQNKQALETAIYATHYGVKVTVDGNPIPVPWATFGPPDAYVTQPDGRVER